MNWLLMKWHELRTNRLIDLYVEGTEGMSTDERECYKFLSNKIKYHTHMAELYEAYIENKKKEKIDAQIME